MGFIPDCFSNILCIGLALVNLGMAVTTDGSYKAILGFDPHALAIL
jgi:hypothetical protein